MKEQGYGVDYLYPHNYPEHFVLQEYMPPELKDTKLYESARNKREVEGGAFTATPLATATTAAIKLGIPTN